MKKELKTIYNKLIDPETGLINIGKYDHERLQEALEEAMDTEPERNGTCDCDVCRKTKTFYRAIMDSPQWKTWDKVAHKHGWDTAGSMEIGDISDEHLQVFFDFIKYEYKQQSPTRNESNHTEAHE